MEMGSVHSLHDVHDTPLPTPPDEKRAATVKRLSYVLGFLYSLFLIILASTVLVKSALINDPWTPIITIYVTVTGMVIMCILIVDIKLFTCKIRKQVQALTDEVEKQESEYLRQLDECAEEIARSLNNSDEFDAATALRNTTAYGQVEMENIEHSYCFAQGKHAGSVYLKFGAAAFALGHFVHTVLLVVTVHWSIAISNVHCINAVEYISTLLQCLYCFVQLFFIFSYSNLIIVKQATIARVAFLHMMAGNICLWITAVTTETKLAYRAYEWVQKKENKTNLTALASSASSTFKNDESCMPSAQVARIFDDYSAYLYPFTVEFNVLVVGVLFMVWRRIEKCRHSSEEIQDFHQSLYAQSSDVNGEINSPHALDIHISCRNAICGLFSGFFVIVAVIVTIILGFVFGNMRDEDFQYVGKLFASSRNLAFHTSMLVASGVAFYKTQSLDINKHPVPWLDAVLLYICVPAFFLESILTVIPSITTLNIVQFLDTIIMIIYRTQ